MAGGIKGITVKIGGDTTELGKALSDAQKKSTALQRELRGVNTLLKFNPSNVTLLKQKADLLKKSIEETRNKLNSLIEVQRKVKSGEIEMTAEEYRNLEREIANTENKLKQLEDEQRKFGSVGAQQVVAYGEKLKELGENVENVGRKFMVLSGIAGGVLASSTKFASDYANEVAKVGTVADLTKVPLDKLYDGMINLSTQTGKSATEIAGATYQAISASVDTASAVDFVGQATNLAKAGFLETADAVDVLTTIINAYGLKASEAGRLSDILVQTQNDGKTTVNELSKSMAQVIPLASAYGVNIENLSASYAQLTKNGIPTAQAGTYLKAMFTELGKEGSKVGQILQNETGKSFGQLMAEGKSLGDVLGILNDSVGGNKEALAQLWGSTEAGAGALAIASAGVDAFNSELDNMNNSTGNVEEALELLDTPSAKLARSLNALKNIGIELGATILSAVTPALTVMAEKLQALFKWFSGLPGIVKGAIVGFLSLVAVTGPLLVGIGKLMQSVGTLMTMAPRIAPIVSRIGLAFSGISLPVIAVVAVIGSLIAIFKNLWNTSDMFRMKILVIFANIKNKAQEFSQGVIDRLNALGFNFGSITEVISAMWNNFCKIFAPVFVEALHIVESVFTYVCDFITGYLDIFIGLFTGNWDQMWQGVGEVFQATVDLLKNLFGGLVKAIVKLVIELKNSFVQKFNEIKTNLTNKMTEIKTNIVNKFTELKTGAVNKINELKSAVTSAFNTLKDKMTSPIKSAKSTIETAISSIKNTVKNIFNGIKPKLNLSLPTVHVNGGSPPWGIGGLGQKPSFSVTWNADGAIFKKPTIFATPAGFQGVGEAGPEAVAPISELMRYVQVAVDNSSIINRIDRLESVIAGGFAGMSGTKIVLDTGVLVGSTINEIDRALAVNQALRARGV